MTSPKPAEPVRVRPRSPESEWWAEYKPSAAMLAQRVLELEAELVAPPIFLDGALRFRGRDAVCRSENTPHLVHLNGPKSGYFTDRHGERDAA